MSGEALAWDSIYSGRTCGVSRAMSRGGDLKRSTLEGFPLPRRHVLTHQGRVLLYIGIMTAERVLEIASQLSQAKASLDDT